jgi:hypothetical protein
MSRNFGDAIFSANFEPRKAAPLDARNICGLKSDLTLLATWDNGDGNAYTYKGMIVVVTSDTTNNGLYKLNDSDYTNIANWEKVGSESSGNENVMYNLSSQKVFWANNLGGLVTSRGRQIKYSAKSLHEHITDLYNSIQSIISGSSIISGTHAEIYNLALNNQLNLSKRYLITDYETKYRQDYTGNVLTGVIEPLIVTPNTDHSFQQEATSASYPDDIIWYDLFDMTCEDSVTARKGKIKFRMDTVNNKSTYYDWRNVKHRRYKVTSITGSTHLGGFVNTYTFFRSSITINGVTFNVNTGDYKDQYTFAMESDINDSSGQNMRNIHIGAPTQNDIITGRNYNNIVIVSNTAATSESFYNIFFEPGCCNIHFKGAAVNVYFDSTVDGYVTSQNSGQVMVGRSSAYIFANQMYSSEIGPNAFQNTFNELSNSEIGSSFQHNRCGVVRRARIEQGIKNQNTESASVISNALYNKTVFAAQGTATIYIQYYNSSGVPQVVPIST